MTDQTLYAQLVTAAGTGLPPSKLGALIGRAFNAGWETGDIYEALNEGGLDMPFETIERLAQRHA